MSYLRSRNPRVKKSISSYFIEFIVVISAILLSAYIINSQIEQKEKDKQELLITKEKNTLKQIKIRLSSISNETEKAINQIQAYLSINRYKSPLDSLGILLKPCVSAQLLTPNLVSKELYKSLKNAEIQSELLALEYLIKQDSKLINERVLPYSESHFDFLKYQQNPKLKRIEFYPSTLDAMLSNSLTFKREILRKTKVLQENIEKALTEE